MLVADIAGHIDENIGAMFLGLIVSSVLLGVSLVQTYYYYISYPKDPWYLKLLVAITAVFDSVHCALVTHTIYHYCISNFSRTDELERLVWSVVMEALFTGVTGCLVQCFYLQRVWRLSKKNYFLTGLILVLVLADASCGTGMFSTFPSPAPVLTISSSPVWVILAIQLKTYQELLNIRAITITINALSTAADVLIAASLWYMLAKARTGFKRSDTMINRLILFVINTGALTTACAAASLIALVASPTTLIYASFYFCIGRLYTNSLLATLNARKTLTGKIDDVSHMLVSMPSTLLNSVSQQKGSQQKSSNIAIRVETNTVHDTGDHLGVPSGKRDPDAKKPVDSDEFVYQSVEKNQSAATQRHKRDSFGSDPSYV